MLTPINVSGRTPAQIIEQAEITWLVPYFVKTDHRDDCRCNTCLQSKLDALVKHSEEALGVH